MNSTTKYSNAMDNVTAKDFDIERFNEIVKNLRNAQKAAAEFGSNRGELEERFNEAKSKLDAAVEALNYEEMSKATAEMKRIQAKLDEDPREKIAAFDKAVDALFHFTMCEGTKTTQLEEVA